MTAVVHLVSAFVPSGWPTCHRILDLAEQIDAAHGTAALEVLLVTWSTWTATGTLPADAAVAELVLALREVVVGGLGPRPMPSAGSIA